MTTKERKIMVGVDASQESMFALFWCITNLIADTPNVKLVLLYVKPPPLLHSFNVAWNMFPSYFVSAVEKHGKDLANSVMERAGNIYKNLHHQYQNGESNWVRRCKVCDMQCGSET
ncbi:uncharacterized protein LOC113863599 isoform X1 [Abrus precatorius]|uniref:Uncharacterized protein LOC113863599 isoform X1 n=1 Tax=Abrus precatorius TaxID=3816 RepID=A0A8B8L9N0_ABRPR|nr:uncharacterized protein LOC113863599 isoform X1 [Abrus precatorius]